MSHLDSRRHHRRAKGLDIGNLSVKGRHGRLQRREKQQRNQIRRRRADRTIHAARHARCSLDDSCLCAGCNDDMPTDRSLAKLDRMNDSLYFCLGPHDRLGPTMAVARAAIGKTSSFSEWFALMKEFFPDTVAGRHALDHAMWELDEVLECDCYANVVDSKHNVRGCNCERPWTPKGVGSPGAT